MKFMRALLIVVFIVLGSLEKPSVEAAEHAYSGSWLVNANSWTFRLTLQQSGNTISGQLTGINNSQVTKIRGVVNRDQIKFDRLNLDGTPHFDQKYIGTLIRSVRHRSMSGTFGHGRTTGYSWCAVDVAILGGNDPNSWNGECGPAKPMVASTKVVKLRFVRQARGGFVPLKEREVLTYGELFYIEAVFGSEPQDGERTVQLEWGEGPGEKVMVYKQKDGKIFRSRAIRLKKP